MKFIAKECTDQKTQIFHSVRSSLYKISNRLQFVQSSLIKNPLTKAFNEGREIKLATIAASVDDVFGIVMAKNLSLDRADVELVFREVGLVEHDDALKAIIISEPEKGPDRIFQLLSGCDWGRSCAKGVLHFVVEGWYGLVGREAILPVAAEDPLPECVVTDKLDVKGLHVAEDLCVSVREVFFVLLRIVETTGSILVELLDQIFADLAVIVVKERLDWSNVVIDVLE